MKKLYVVLGVVISVILLLALIFISSYNALVRLDENVNSYWAQVENQLKRRADLIPNLVETVKGYVSHEEEIFIEVSKARSGIINAKTPEEYAKANEELNKALSQFNLVIEKYPELKADQHFTSLMDELAGTENRLAVTRKDYNDAVRKYNFKVRRFPSNIFARIFGFEQRSYFEINEEDTKVPEVKF